MRKHPNPDRIDEFVAAIREINGDRMVDMDSVYKPSCNTPGCHAGEAFLALNHIGFPESPYALRGVYRYSFEAMRLSSFLFENAESYQPIEFWAENYPELWGNDKGLHMFSQGEAFEQDDQVFPYTVIADHWEGVAKRIREAENDD